MLTLSLGSLAALFIALLLLALVPGTSVLVVSSRAATSGFKQIQRANRPPPRAALPVTVRSAASFAMGFFLTLIDVKAIVVYLGLLQAFVDPDALNATDVLAVMATAVVAVGGAKLGYAFAAAKLEKWIGPRLGRNLVRVGGGVRIAVGVYLIATAFGIGPALEVPPDLGR